MSHKENEPNFTLQTWAVVLGAIMAIITGTLSAFLTDYLTQRAWTSNANYQQRVAVFQKRLDLIERTSQLAGKAPGLNDVWQRYLQEIRASPKNGAPESPDTSLSEKLGEYNGQFRAMLEMDALFFGPKTREAIASLKPAGASMPYWEYPTDGMNRLLSAMGSELQSAPVGSTAEDR
jgi:hypothetical protein